VEDLVASAVEIHIPFNNPVTGFCAFTHKAGIHAKAILANPATYEIINPADFGMQRYVHFTSRLTGWNAIKSRCDQLGLNMTDAQIKQCTMKIKALADIRKVSTFQKPYQSSPGASMNSRTLLQEQAAQSSYRLHCSIDLAFQTYVWRRAADSYARLAGY